MASGDVAAMPIVDAHQHFWDIAKNYYPWLCDSVPIPFRYGDYSALRRNYLPPDYARDSAGFNIVKTVHMEAEWDRANPVAETRWLEAVNREFGLPSACIGHAEPDRPDIEDVLAGHAKSSMVRGIRHKPTAASDPREAGRGATGSMDDSVWRKGYALLERFGFSYDLQTPWWHLDAAADLAADFPRIRIVINHTGLPADRSREGLAAWRRALAAVAAQPNIGNQDFRPRPRRAAVADRGQRTGHSRRDRNLRRRALHVRQQLSGRPPRRHVRHNLWRLPGVSRRFVRSRSTQAVSR